MAPTVNRSWRVLVMTLLLSISIGLSLGALGGGGSTLTVPILTYVAGMAPADAIASSLFIVSATSSVGVLVHARARRVQWRTAVLFGASGMTGSYAGGRLAGLLPARVALLLFACTMLVAAAAMLLRPRAAPRTSGNLSLVQTVSYGAVVGIVTGLIGAGGGFLVVPALVLLGGLSINAAIGTSLVVIAMQSAAAFAGRLGHVDVDWGLTLEVTAIATGASLLGAWLTRHTPPARLQRVFAYFILALALAMGAAEVVR